jgi:uncharacterized protein (TIGR03435 family)
MRLRTSCAVGLTIAALVHAQKPERLTFEVASIKLANPDEQGGGIKAMPGGQRYVATNVPVKLIFSLMYKVPLRQITGGPAWLDTERYDIEATAAHSYDLDDLHTMFQNLLADEFKLRFHKEIREGPVYVLSVDKAGSKMKLNQSAQDFKIPMNTGKGGEVIGTRVPMNYLCWWLSQVALAREERPVIDTTGLDQFYDFTLEFAPELPPGVNAENLPPGLSDRPNIFTALKEQLGLRLEPQKGPVEFYVIDHAERPAAN